jgi:hypothetical protein
MDSQMNSCPWEKINDFQSLSEFNRFVDWMMNQVASGEADETPVQNPYVGATTFREKWFRHKATGTIWRLVWPDAPFKGVFEPVGKGTT